jgi:hypothetical protein
MKLVDWIVKLNSDMLRQGPKGDESEYLERLANMIVVRNQFWLSRLREPPNN